VLLSANDFSKLVGDGKILISLCVLQGEIYEDIQTSQGNIENWLWYRQVSSVAKLLYSKFHGLLS
jgi:hypothetical protein